MTHSMSSCAARVAGALVSLSLSAAHAQSNVTVYGILDTGVTHVSNAAGSSVTLVDTGIMQGSRLGFRGTEDLGNGTSAMFALEQGLMLDTGALGQGGLAFGRQSWVGLSNKSLGTITIGRQYDFMFDSLVGYIIPTMTAGGYANNPLDNDRMSGQRLNNSVKYRSPAMSGFSFGALVSLSESANGISGPGYTRSFGANYNKGDFSAGAAYTYVQGASLDTRALVGASTAQLVGGVNNTVYGVGASYKLSSQVQLFAVANESKFLGATAAATVKFRNVEGGFAYMPVPQWRLGAALNTTKLRDNDYRQINLTADYSLSKRTDAYVQFIQQRASGSGATASIFILPASSTSEQAAYRIGVRHIF